MCVIVCIAVLAADYASCLHMLMKYPPIADMQYFIDMARYLREPNVRSPHLTKAHVTFATKLLHFVAQQISLGNCQLSIGQQSPINSDGNKTKIRDGIEPSLYGFCSVRVL